MIILCGRGGGSVVVAAVTLLAGGAFVAVVAGGAGGVAAARGGLDRAPRARAQRRCQGGLVVTRPDALLRVRVVRTQLLGDLDVDGQLESEGSGHCEPRSVGRRRVSTFGTLPPRFGGCQHRGCQLPV